MMNLITQHLHTWTAARMPKNNGGRGRGKNSNGQNPHGIKKLRELILELAVRGKLVPQDPRDEPASELLKKITREKARLIKEGKIKKQKPLPEIKEEEKPFELPKGWEWTLLGNLSANIHYGYTASAILGKSEIKLLRISDIQRDSVNWETVPGCKIEKNKTNDYLLENEDILIARTGGTIGKSYLVENINDKAVFASYLIRVTRIDGMYSPFIKNFLGSRLYWKQLYENSMGTGQPNVNATALKRLRFPLPPLAEQRRVVTKVDELMALCDKLEQEQINSDEAHQTLVETLLNTLTTAADNKEFAKAWKRIANDFDTLFTTEESIDQLKQTILQLAVMGKLVPQGPKDEPAQELLKKISREKARLIKEGKIKKQKPLPEIREEEKPFELPKGWEWARLSNCYDVRDGTHDSPKYQTNGFPLVTSKNLSSGKLDLTNLNYISEKDHLNIIQRSKVDKGDVLFAMIGSIGNPVIVDTDDDFSIKNVALFKYYIAELSSPKYLKNLLESAAIVMRENATGGVQAFVSLGILRAHVIPLPPLAEQRRIVTKVDELMALCDSLKERLREAQTIQVQLADAVVEKAVA